MNMRNKWIAAAAAAACALLGGGVALVAATPALAVADGYGTGDGLNRYVLTLTTPAPASTSATPQTAAGTTTTVSPMTSTTALSDSTARGLDLTLLRQAQTKLGAGGHVVQDNGTAYYVMGTAAILVSPGGTGTVTALASTLTEPVAAINGPPTTTSATPAPVSDTALAALAAHAGVKSAQRTVNDKVLIATDLSLADIRAIPGVATAEQSVTVPVASTNPTDPYYAPYSWNLHNTGSNAYQQVASAGADIDAPTGWDTSQGQDTIVAIVDTGFDTTHTDLIGSLWNNPSEACGTADVNSNGYAGDCHGWNFYANSADLDNGGTMDEHGTSVAGVVGARMNTLGSVGVAPQTKIMPLVVGGGSTVDINLAIMAIRYAADNGADVINASFGGAFSGPTLTAMSDAIDYATSKGALVVAAAGNDSLNRDTTPMYPASLPNAGLITVGSSTATDIIADHSAYGATSVDLFAPGQLVFTTQNNGGYYLVSGTSIAAPHVAAAVALYKSVNPNATPSEIKAAILADTVKIPAMAGKSVSGGRLTIGNITAAAGAETTTYTFSGMVAKADVQTPTVTVASTAIAGSYKVTFGLAMNVDGEIWAVAGEDVTLAGQTLTTNDQGQVTFDLGSKVALGTQSLTPTLSLGEGSFALTAQIVKDGTPLTRPYAAPLLVSATATVPDPSATTTPTPVPSASNMPSTGNTPKPSASTTPTSSPTSPAPGPTSSASPTPGTGGTSAPTPAPTTSTAPTPGTGGSTPTPTPTSGGGGISPSPTASVMPTPKPTSGTPTPSPTVTPTTPASSPSASPSPTSGAGAGTDIKSYPAVGVFGLTSISPVHVSITGGTLVRITGTRLETGLSVRVGDTRNADVITSTTTEVTFLTPTAIVGTFDVTVYKNGLSSVLTAALVYQSGTVVTPGPGTASPTPTAMSTPSASPSPSPSASTSPSATTPTPAATVKPTASPSPTSDGSGGSGGTTPTTPNATRSGPNGERLVRYDALSSLVGLWSTSCPTVCTGQQV